jgi:hypothetical protein
VRRYRGPKTPIDGSFQIVKELKQERKRGQSPFPKRQNRFFLGLPRKRALTPFSFFDGGADRDRTGDPLLAKQVLSQLSYSPSSRPPTVLETSKSILRVTPTPWLLRARFVLIEGQPGEVCFCK